MRAILTCLEIEGRNPEWFIGIFIDIEVNEWPVIGKPFEFSSICHECRQLHFEDRLPGVPIKIVTEETHTIIITDNAMFYMETRLN